MDLGYLGWLGDPPAPGLLVLLLLRGLSVDPPSFGSLGDLLLLRGCVEDVPLKVADSGLAALPCVGVHHGQVSSLLPIMSSRNWLGDLDFRPLLVLHFRF